MRNLATHVWLKLDRLKGREAFSRLGPGGRAERVGHEEWGRTVVRVAVGLMDAGLEEGQRVALAAPNTADAVAVALGTWIAGGCVVWLAPGAGRATTLRKAAQCTMGAHIRLEWEA